MKEDRGEPEKKGDKDTLAPETKSQDPTPSPEAKAPVPEKPPVKEEVKAEEEAPIPSPPKKQLEKIHHSSIVICDAAILQDLTQDQSNFTKIIESLNISHMAQQIVSSNELQRGLNLEPVKAIWTIGLNQEDKALLNNLRAKILHTGNPETMQTKEEKIALFTPLKAFSKSL